MTNQAKTITNSRIKVVKATPGTYVRNTRTEWDVYVDGKLVASDYRKWLVTAVGNAIVAGHIEPTGDTIMRLAIWAAKNDQALLNRMPEHC